MIIIIVFISLAVLFDVPDVRANQSGKLPLFWTLTMGLLIWNSLAVSFPWWPDPNDAFKFMFGWVDQLIRGA